MISRKKSTAIKYARLEQLTASNGLAMVNSTLLAAMLAYVLRDLVSQIILAAWLFAFVCLNIIRFVLILKHKRNPALTDEMIDTQLIQFRVGLIASGVLWAIASVFMYPQYTLSHQMFFIFILAGLSAGCVVAYSVDFISAMTFVMLLLAPILVCLFFGEGEVALAMTVSVLLYIAFMIASIRYVNQSLLQSISARYDAAAREKDIKQLAFYDVLTDLPNRRLMIDRIDHALALNDRAGRGGALLFLDLDNFKTLNDSFGHAMGDLLLKQVAERLLISVRSSDTVARLGGDEFIVMLEDLSQDSAEAISQADVTAKQIITSLNLPFQLNSLEYHCTASIGIAMFGEDGSTHEELLKNADIAMYKAKKAGRNVARFFNSEMQETADLQLV